MRRLGLALALLFFVASRALALPAFDAASANSGGGTGCASSGVSTTLSVVDGTNGVILILAGDRSGTNRTVSSVTVDGSAATHIISNDVTTSASADTYYYLNSATGDHVVNVKWNNTTSFCSVAALSYTGVDQTTVFENAGSVDFSGSGHQNQFMGNGTTAGDLSVFFDQIGTNDSGNGTGYDGTTLRSSLVNRAYGDKTSGSGNIGVTWATSPGAAFAKFDLISATAPTATPTSTPTITPTATNTPTATPTPTAVVPVFDNIVAGSLVSGSNCTGTGSTGTLTVNNATNGVIVIVASDANGTNRTVASVTVDGVSAFGNHIISKDVATSASVDAYYYLNGTTGDHPIVVKWDSGCTNGTFVAASYTGVDQTTVFENAGSTTFSGAGNENQYMANGTTANDLTVAAERLAAGSSGTETGYDSTTTRITSSYRPLGDKTSGSGNIGFTWPDSQGAAFIKFELIPAANATPTPTSTATATPTPETRTGQAQWIN